MRTFAFQVTRDMRIAENSKHIAMQDQWPPKSTRKTQHANGNLWNQRFSVKFAESHENHLGICGNRFLINFLRFSSNTINF